MKKIVALLLALVLAASLAACGSASAKTFEAGSLAISLNSGFSASDLDGYVKVFKSKDMYVFVIKEDKAGFGGKTFTFREYGEYLRMANATKNPGQIKTEGNVSYFEYEKLSDGTMFTYLTAFYEANDAFWTVQFAAPSENYSALRSDIINMAGSVSLR